MCLQFVLESSHAAFPSQYFQDIAPFKDLYFLCLNNTINKTLNLLARGKAVEVDRLVLYAGYLDDQDERDELAYSVFSLLRQHCCSSYTLINPRVGRSMGL